jgi:hypothetical protein
VIRGHEGFVVASGGIYRSSPPPPTHHKNHPSPRVALSIAASVHPFIHAHILNTHQITTFVSRSGSVCTRKVRIKPADRTSGSKIEISA